MSKIGMTLEIELGITGGEEDGVDNSNVDDSKLYTQPEEVAYAYEELSKISDKFTIAAAFGNVHGVYKPGNVKLTPKILKNSQDFISEKYNVEHNTINFVFHGGSGSSVEEIRENTMAQFATQQRTVTKEDYIIRTLSLLLWQKIKLSAKKFLVSSLI